MVPGLDEWSSEHRLYDWGRGGLRTYGKRRLRSPETGRQTSTFHPCWLGEFSVEPCPAGVGFIRCLKSLTGDVYTVYARRGRYWVRSRIIAPAWAMREARRKYPRADRHWADRYTQPEHERALGKIWSDMEVAS